MEKQDTLALRDLGEELRARRKALRIPSAELARRIGVSPTYIWLIEQAKSRPSGSPSRPGERLLNRWMSALGIPESEQPRLREMAGYFTIPTPSAFAPDVAPAWVAASAPISHRAVDAVVDEASETFHVDEIERLAARAPARHDAERLTAQLEHVLRVATEQRRLAEVAPLLRSFLLWLESHVTPDT